MRTMTPDLVAWLRDRTDNSVTASRLESDVSGRKFWRVEFSGETMILMDSGKIPIWPWIDVHELLSCNGFSVPKIIECNTRKGWALQEDLGGIRLLDVDDQAYQDQLDLAMDMIVEMQRVLDTGVCSDSIAGRRSFTPAFFMAELELTLETIFFRLLKVPMEELLELQREMRGLCGCLQESTVFTHRDFHSANLMVKNDNLFMVDWQDARFGPPAYDVVSLLRDSYRDAGGWEERAKKFVVGRGDMNMFQIAQAACQRSLKAIGTFGFHYRKTGDTGYLGFIPRTFRYLADYARICPGLGGLVDRTYALLDQYHGEIDLRDFRSSNIPGTSEA